MTNKTILKFLLIVCFTASINSSCKKDNDNANAQTKIYDFPFDNSLSATVGTGTLSSTGNTFTTDRHGNTNSALSLTNGARESLSSLPLDSSARTISVWFNIPAVPSSPHNICKYGSFTGAGVFGVYIDKNSDLLFQTGVGDVQFNTSFQPNTWTHLAFSLSNNTIVSLYINGVLDKSFNTEETTLNTLSSAFQLGENNFTAKFDDLKIYNYALTAKQVQNIYENK
ncbi:MAG: LamG domain-containing protein [Chitinophagaceae bacterium]|nr:LamG domain-containing protein [Chitinophagaceae bacterium]